MNFLKKLADFFINPRVWFLITFAINIAFAVYNGSVAALADGRGTLPAEKSLNKKLTLVIF